MYATPEIWKRNQVGTMCTYPKTALTMLLLVVAGAAVAAPPNVTHRFMGWYGAHGLAPEIAGWSNAYMSFHESDLVNQHHAFGFTHQMLQVEGYFFHTNATTGHYAMHSDYARRLAKKKSLWDALLNNGTMIGFFLGDELMLHHLPYESLVQVSNALRTAFPSAFQWENEAGIVYKNASWANATMVPPALNATSVDLYDFSADLKNRSKFIFGDVREYYTHHLKPKLWPGQKLFVIPGADGSTANPKCDFACTDKLLATDAELFLQWMQEDSSIIGAMPWMWRSCGKGCDKIFADVGCRNLVKGKAAWERIGRAITRLPLD